jgi:hypothetical protein
MLIGALLFDRRVYRAVTPPLLLLVGLILAVMSFSAAHAKAERVVVSVQSSAAAPGGGTALTVITPGGQQPQVVQLPAELSTDAPTSGVTANRVEIARATAAAPWQTSRALDRTTSSYPWVIGTIGALLLLSGAFLLFRYLRSR